MLNTITLTLTHNNFRKNVHMFLISDVYPLTCPSEVVYVPYATINDTVIIRYNNTGVATSSSTIHIQYHPPAGSLISINDHVNVMATAYDAAGNSTSCNFTYEATSKFFLCISKSTVKVLLFVGTNFPGFYKIHLSVNS